MRKSPGRIARPLCLLMALGFCAAAVVALAAGATRRGEDGVIAMQIAFCLAILAIMWALVGIMFTLARPGTPAREPQPEGRSSRQAEPAEPKRNWFQDSAPATSGRR